jgi:outer membrane protein TolC
VKATRLDLVLAAYNVAAARAAFLPLLNSSVQRLTARQPSQTNPDGTLAVASSSNVNVTTGVSQTLPWLGTRYQANWSSSRQESAGSFATFNPRLGSSLQLSFTQPLWRNLVTDASRVGLKTSRLQQSIADLDVQQNVVTLEVAVRTAYLGLQTAVASRQVAQQNMALVQQQLERSRSMVAIGAAPSMDVVQAEAQVANYEEAVIIAESSVAAAEDALRSMIVDPSRPDYWQVRFDATDPIQLTPRQVDVDAAITNALATRLDLQQARRTREVADLTVALDRALTRPDVNLQVNYSASGSGGTQTVDGVPNVTSFGRVLNDAFGGTYPAWVVGLNVSYPLGRSAASATLARAELQKQQQDLTLRTLELSVVASVRQAARNVETSYRRVTATRAAVTANEQQVDAEQRKAQVGLSDVFTLLQKQQLLAQARIAELNATISYNQALLEFDRVQKIR